MELNRYFVILILLLLGRQGLSQSFGFGRNKVQYTKFNWQILETEHFNIYYYSDMKEAAEKGAAFAEEGFRDLEKRFNYSITRRIPLILYSSHLHFQQTNVSPGFIPEGVGGFFEFMKGRVVVPGNGDFRRFRRVIRHELVHVFMHAKLYNLARRYDRAEPAAPPLWFTEGLAEFWSGGWDSQGEMVLKDAVLHNYVVGLQDIVQVRGTYFMYKLGQDILTYISHHFGDDKILLLMENFWKYDQFEQSFKETLGLSYRQFDEAYLPDLKKRFYPKLADEDFNAAVCPTIVRDGYNFKPVYYKSGGKEYVISTGNRDGYSSIYQSPLQALAPEQKDKRKRIIKGEASSKFEAFHLFSSKIDVNDAGILTFSAKSGASDILYLFDLNTDTVSASLRFGNIVGIASPAWSGDGTEIVFSGLSCDGQLDLYTYHTVRKKLTRLTDDFYADYDPVFSPGGKYIAFSSGRSAPGKKGAQNLVLLERESGRMFYLTYGEQIDKSPAFSPDGRYLVYASDLSGTFDLCLIKNPLEHSRLSAPLESFKLTRFVGSAFDPCWVDSSRLLYSTFENNRFQIRLLNNFLSEAVADNKIEMPVFPDSNKAWTFAGIRQSKIEKRRSYVSKFTLDFAQSQVSQDPFWGTSGGAQMAFTDMLGNEQYFLTVFNNARVSSDFWSSFNVAVQKVSLRKRLNYALGAYRFAGFYYNPEDFYYYEEKIGGSLILSYPLSHFSRISLNQNVYYSDKNRFFSKRRKAWINASFFSFVFDNSIWGPSGPMDGSRINIGFGNTFDFARSQVNYITGLIDLRTYYRASLRTAYAVRLLSLFNEGAESRQFYFGGSWDLRLYRRWSMHGKRIFLLSQEFRFPLVDLLALRFPTFSLGFRSIRGALFFDAGNAWNKHFEGLKGSFGLGVRLNLGNMLVLRWDIGRKTDFHSITDETVTHFFFGWDF